MEQLRGGALGAMPRTKKVLTRVEAKAMALRDGVEQVVLTQDINDMERVANERKERAEEARRRLSEAGAPDPEALSEIVQFMRKMAGDPGRRKMADNMYLLTLPSALKASSRSLRANVELEFSEVTSDRRGLIVSTHISSTPHYMYSGL